MEKLKWTTEKVKVCDLIPATDNPRQWRETGEAELDDSLQKFDLVEIPVADFDNTLIAGHRRMERLIAAGRANELIDVRKPNRQLTTEERKEYMLRSNIHQGEWDAEKLTEAFEGFDFEGLGMDVAGLPDNLEPIDYSGKNKEIDIDGFEDKCTLKLEYTLEEYNQVKAELHKVAATPEAAVWKLLGLPDDE